MIVIKIEKQETLGFKKTEIMILYQTWIWLWVVGTKPCICWLAAILEAEVSSKVRLLIL